MKQRDDLRGDIVAFWKKSQKVRSIPVQGTSMRPLIHEGDRITCRPLASPRQVQIGDIVLFQSAGGLVAHRIVGKKQQGDEIVFQEKGDNRFYPTCIPGTAIAARIVAVQKAGLSIDLTKWHWTAVNRALGYYWLVLFGLLQAMRHCKKKLLGDRRVPGSGAYRRCMTAIAKLPTRLMRSRKP
ncbi:signal peptidase I [Thermodesulfobacteriota bacterium]